MKTVTDISQLKGEPGPIVLAAGFFDGLHAGHLRVVERAVQRARKLRGKAWALTFDPHPLKILSPDSAPLLLTSNRHRLAMLGAMDVDGCILMPFTRRLSLLEPAEFAEKMCACVPPLAEVVVGGNWRFGKDGKGDASLLAKLGRKCGLAVTTVKPVTMKGAAISSTRIRSEIMNGRLESAAAMLGRPFSVLGTVVKGRSIGTQIGFPTANLTSHNEVLPPCGVYAVRARLAGQLLDGVFNLGYRPTINKARSGRPMMELHLFGINRELYGQEVEVFFLKKLRNEQEFPSLEELGKQIARDVASARKVLSKARR